MTLDSAGTRGRDAGSTSCGALLRLVERGVLSAEEFERQQEKVFRRPPRT